MEYSTAVFIRKTIKCYRCSALISTLIVSYHIVHYISGRWKAPATHGSVFSYCREIVRSPCEPGTSTPAQLAGVAAEMYNNVLYFSTPARTSAAGSA